MDLFGICNGECCECTRYICPFGETDESEVRTMNSAAEWFADAEQRERVEKSKRMTNGDKIRSMTDDKLAKFLNKIVYHCREESCNDECPMADCCACDYDWQEKWLKQEAKDDED